MANSSLVCFVFAKDSGKRARLFFSKCSFFLAGLVFSLTGCVSGNYSSDTQRGVSTTAFDYSFEADSFFVFNSMEEIQYPYHDEVKRYLMAGFESDISEYDYASTTKQAKEVVVSWTRMSAEIDAYCFIYSVSASFSKPTIVTLGPSDVSYSFRFLYPDTDYYFQVSALYRGRNVFSTGHFKTTALGPRFLDVGDSMNNCRDLGGYECGDKRIKYDVLFRGSYPNSLTPEGLSYLSNVKTQLDLRGHGEIIEDSSSLFYGANYIRVPCVAYMECFKEYQKESYRQAFEVFANPNNYPIYFHCWGGADRTGTVAAILLGVLGASRGDIIIDYVLTSFSAVCLGQDARKKEDICSLFDNIELFDGSSFSEKCESFLVSLGVTEDEITTIKNICLF